MGALCGKESRDDNFAGPGRRLDSSPDQSPTAPLPSNKRVVGGPPRTLGGSSSGGGEASSSDAADARRKAAEAAEVSKSLQHCTGMINTTPAMAPGTNSFLGETESGRRQVQWQVG